MWKGSVSYAICRLVDWHACITARNLEDILLRFPIVIKRFIYCLFLQVELVDSYTGRLPFECTVCIKLCSCIYSTTKLDTCSKFLYFHPISFLFQCL